MNNEDDVFLFFVFFKNKMINSFRLVTFGPIAIRTVTGATFIINGWPKLLDIKQTQGFFMIMGLPQELAAFMALLEVFGDALLIIGILTRILTFLFTIEMIRAFIIPQYLPLNACSKRF